MIDIVGPLDAPRSGHRFALGIMDGLFVPLRSTTSRTIMYALLSRWIALFGSPKNDYIRRRT